MRVGDTLRFGEFDHTARTSGADTRLEGVATVENSAMQYSAVSPTRMKAWDRLFFEDGDPSIGMASQEFMSHREANNAGPHDDEVERCVGHFRMFSDVAVATILHHGISLDQLCNTRIKRHRSLESCGLDF